MSAPLLPIDPTVEDRLADINGNLGRLSASVHVAARILTEAGLCQLDPLGIEASLLGLTLQDVYDGLMREMDRLDKLELLAPPSVATPAT